MICFSLDGGQFSLTPVTLTSLPVVGRPHGSHRVLQVPLVLHVGSFLSAAHVSVTIWFAIDVLEVVVIVSVVLVSIDIFPSLASLFGPGLHLPALSLSERGSVPGLVPGGNPLHGGLRGLLWLWRSLTF